MGKKTLVVDTNIFVSAFGWMGKPHMLVSKIMDNQFHIAVSEELIHEIKVTMLSPRLGFSPSDVEEYLALIEERAIYVNPTYEEACDDIKDNIILGIAVSSGTDIIITGDDDLLRLKEHKGIKIMTVSEFLKQHH